MAKAVLWASFFVVAKGNSHAFGAFFRCCGRILNCLLYFVQENKRGDFMNDWELIWGVTAILALVWIAFET
jgi:hypothetical protein